MSKNIGLSGFGGILIGSGISLVALGIGFVAPIIISVSQISEKEPQGIVRAPVFPQEEAIAPEGLRGRDPEMVRRAASAKAKALVAKAGKTGSPSSKPEHTGVASAALGEKLYANFCMVCHQAEGMGKVGLAPFIRNPDFLALASDRYLKTSIMNGRPGTAMAPMAYLKPHELDSLVAYLRTAEKPGGSKLTKADPDLKHPGEAALGKPLYNTYCASCHGPNMTGYAEGGPGPGIGNPGFLAVASDDFIFQTVKHGRVGTSMRPFVGSRGLANLNDGDVGDIIAYIREQGGVAPPVVAKREAGDPIAGEMHYTANCSACHQPNGSGKPGFAPGIGSRDFLSIASDKFIKETVHKGRPGTTMAARADLNEQVLDDIIAYLRALPEGGISKVDVDPTKDLASLGDHKQGLQTFNNYCASCHGESGKGYIAGGPGSAIGLQGFLGVASDDYIFQTLKLGRAGTAMRPFLGSRGLANLSEKDAYDIIAYLRSLQ